MQNNAQNSGEYYAHFVDLHMTLYDTLPTEAYIDSSF